MELRKESNKKISIVEMQNSLKKEGAKTGMITIDNVPFVGIGYSSEKDKERVLNLFSKVFEETGGDPYKTAMKMQELALLGEQEVVADKEIEVEGEDFVISFEKKAAYRGGNKYVDLDDLQAAKLTNDAVEIILTERIKNKLLLEKEEDDEEDECFFEED